MKIFLTGATGFVGHHVARALAGEGAELRLLVRKTSKLANLEGFAGETHVGDLSEPETLRSALGGCDAVVHVAADYRLWIPDPAAMYRANVDGTRELLGWRARRACRAWFILERGDDALSDRRDCDQRRHAGFAGDMVGHYKRSKFLAEQVATAAAKGAESDDPESDDADWVERCEADADRADLCGFS